MSAPPIAADVVHPLAIDKAALPARHIAPIAGAVGAKVRKAPIVAALAASMPPFMRCRPGSTRGRELMRPASFRKARMDPICMSEIYAGVDLIVYSPVKVMPPISTPRYAVVR
jgi:hypothetical protein